MQGRGTGQRDVVTETGWDRKWAPRTMTKMEKRLEEVLLGMARKSDVAWDRK